MRPRRRHRHVRASFDPLSRASFKDALALIYERRRRSGIARSFDVRVVVPCACVGDLMLRWDRDDDDVSGRVWTVGDYMMTGTKYVIW